MTEFIPQNEPSYGQEEKVAVAQYLDSGGWITEHKETLKFENQIAKFMNSKHCILLSNGTVTLFCALKACGIGPGDEVLCPNYTMIATANAISLTGAKPVLVDIENDTQCMDIQEAHKAITLKTKAIMLVSINGRYPRTIYSIPEGLAIVEDAAQSFGSYHNGRHIGSYFPDIASFSFSMPKIITTGQGGCLATNNDLLNMKIRAMKDFGRITPGSDDYSQLGYNFKFTDLQAAFGIAQLSNINKKIKRKKEIYSLYRDLLSNVKGIRLYNNDTNTPWMIDAHLESRRDRFIEEMKKNSIGIRPFYPTISSTPMYFSTQVFPNSRYASEQGVWLPSSLKLTDGEIQHICQTIREVL